MNFQLSMPQMRHSGAHSRAIVALLGKMAFCLTVLWNCLYPITVKATHSAGADMTYECLGGLTYRLTCTFYRDCGGSAEPSSITISYRSVACSYARTVQAYKAPSGNGTEITMPCASAGSTCNGGITTGISKWIYEATVTLPFACSDWVFSYKVCCRNCTITTIQSPCASGSDLYVEATLNNLLAPGNSSPVFNNSPIAFVCLGQNFNYNHGVSDADGDSLVYELITPQTDFNDFIAWIPPASALEPVSSSTPFILNPVTGDINFTPSALQIGILAIRVNEYRGGLLIGSTVRDMQVYVNNCGNYVPVSSGINGSSAYDTLVCAGTQVCFDMVIHDPDSTNQVVTYSLFNPIAGSTIIQTGTQPLTLKFCWTPSETDIGPAPKTFTLTLRDDACPVNGMQTFSYSLFVRGPRPAISQTNPTCTNGTDGSATVILTNPASCSILWHTIPPQSTHTITNLGPGTYSVTVTDSGGCVSIANATLLATQSPPLVSCTITGAPVCQTSSNAVISAIPTGGTAPYVFLWNTGVSTPSIHNAVPGYYTVTVTDANGCSDTSGILLQGMLSNPLVTIDSMVSSVCFGSNDGMLQAGVTGGAPPYSYVWNTGATSGTLTGIPAATYTLTVTDSIGCTSTVTAVLPGPSSPLNGSVHYIQGVTCYGYLDGSAVITASGGTAPYQYIWNTGATGSAQNNLGAGSYIVTIADGNGCTSQTPITISQPAAPLLATTMVSVPIGCHGDSTGTADLTVQGGTAPYSYQWSNGASIEDPMYLAAGSYQVTVTDAAGCTTGSYITFQEPDPLAISTQLQHVSCFGGTDGSIRLQVQGGIPPFTFLWGQGGSSGMLQGLVAGNYSVVVTDSEGCTSSQIFEITQPVLPLTAAITTIQPACNGSATGTVAIAPAGGTQPYSILWSNGHTSDTLTHLAPGTYQALITDLNGCTFSLSAEVTIDTAFMNVSAQLLQPVSCYGGSDASAGVVVTGGTMPYSYNWSNGQTSAVTTGMSPGQYSASVTDANGCWSTVNLTVPGAPPAIIMEVTTVPAQCLTGQLGSAQVMIQGGTAPYDILWSNNASSEYISGLAAGIYTATITDANGCTGQVTATVADHSTFELKSIGPHTICSGETANLVCDSFPGYSYQWFYEGLPLNGVTSTGFSTPAAGYYYVSLTGPCGTFYSDSVLITVRTFGNVSVSSGQIICPPETAQLHATGGTTYEWSPAAFITLANVPDPVVSPLQTTIYQVAISDDYGCKTFLSTTVTVICDSLFVPTGFSPDGDGTNDGYVIPGIEQYPGNKIWVYNRWGRLVYKARGYKNDWNGTGNVSGIFMNRKVHPGTYYYILDLGDNQKPRSGYLIIRY